MVYIIIIIVVGAFIQSFLHHTKGVVHDFELYFAGPYCITFIASLIYSIIRYGWIYLLIIPAVFFISNLVFSIIFSKVFDQKRVDRLYYKDLLKTIILNLASGNYSYEFVNGGYSYSKEVTDIFMVLSDTKLQKIYEECLEKYNAKAKKALDKKDPLTFTIDECLIYLNWLWHIEGSGLASGIILKRIEDNRYLYTLKRLYDLM